MAKPLKAIRKGVSVVTRRKQKPVGRITNDTLDEHREHILTSGRRFKYPMQYARHRLVINTIILSIGILLVAALLTWWQLYKVQNTSALAYRITQALPLPVASVDGNQVRYSDYLVRYRSEIYWLEQNNQINLSTDDGKRQGEYRKRHALDEVIANAYAAKVAQDRDISINDTQIDAFITQARQAQGVSISEDAYYRAQYDAYGWSKTEVRNNIRDSLLRQAVAFAVDSGARATADRVHLLANVAGSDFTKIASDNTKDSVTAGDSGSIPVGSEDPNGIIKAISGFATNQTSDVIQGTDGFYIARLVDKSATQIHYVYLKIGLNEFTNNLQKLKDGGRVKEYISITSGL